MKTVWKCDYCHRIDDDSNVIAVHEERCSCNPLNKNCMSCSHKQFGEYETAFDVTGCNNANVEWEYAFDVRDDEKKCDHWEPEQ